MVSSSSHFAHCPGDKANMFAAAFYWGTGGLIDGLGVANPQQDIHNWHITFP